MAIYPGDFTNNINFEENSGYAIKGKMISSSLSITELDIIQSQFDINTFLKEKLVLKLAEEIARNNCVEFTKQKDHLSGTIMARARIFVVPNDAVQILRLLPKNNNG